MRTAAEPATVPFPLRGFQELAGGRLVFSTAETRYPSVPPALFNFRCRHPRRLRRFFDTLGRHEVHCPAEVIVGFAKAWVIDGKFLLTTERIGVGESFADVTLSPAFIAAMADRLAAIEWDGCEHIAETAAPVVHIFKEGAANYGHLIAEILPKFVHLAAAGLRRCRVLLPAAAEPFCDILNYAAERFGLALEYLRCRDHSVVRVERLLWVGPVSRHDVRKSPTLLAMADRLLAGVPADGGPSRLFVTRPADGKRPCRNIAVIEYLAEQAGYTVVEPWRLSFAEQLRLFRGAKAILGPLGAGLANAFAMPAGCSVAMIDPGLMDFFFWDLACLKGQTFNWIFSAEVFPFVADLLQQPADIDPGLARSALSWLDAA